MWQLLDGAATMHIAGIMQQNLKPDNISISPHDDLKISDFST